jgi:hypothetical protein
MSEDENVVTFRPPLLRPVEADAGETEISDTLTNLVNYCERLEEGMKHFATIVVAMDSRVRRLELALNKAEREKVTKTAIYNPQGKRVM